MVFYFIKRDFLGFPLKILQGEYEGGILKKGDFGVPYKLYNKLLYFQDPKDILDYKICSCRNGESCRYNKELKRLAEEWINTSA